MSNKNFTTSTPADVSEVINPDIPTEIEFSEDFDSTSTDNEGLNNDCKTEKYDPDQIDSVIDVVNDADPIGSEDCDTTETPATDKCEEKTRINAVAEEPKWAKTKRTRKAAAKRLLLVMSVISMFAVNGLFTMAMEFAWALFMTETAYRALNVVFITLNTVGHMAAYSFIEKNIY